MTLTGRRRGVLVVAAWAGVAALQVLLANAYLVRGTWWHYLLHQQVGWGVGLAVAGLVAGLTRYRVPAVLALLLGQLASIVPDLQFRFQRMPHLPSMDVWLGHISVHTGPAPLLVSLGALLLGGWGWLAGHVGRPRAAVGLSAGALGLVLVACLLADPLPSRLADFPGTSAPAAQTR